MLDEATLALRKGRITSSLAAACLGLDSRKTPLQAWLEIRGEGTFEGNRLTERGNRLEGTIFEYGCERVGAYEWRVPPFVVHPDTPWAGDSCDVTYHDDFGVLMAVGEGKSVGPFSMVEWGEEETDQVPQRVRIQADWHLWHYPQAPFCAVPIVGGSDFVYRYYRVDRDNARIESLAERLHRWHRDHVVAGRQPPVTASESDTVFLNNRVESPSPVLAACTAPLESLVRDTIEARKVLRFAEQEVSLLQNQLREKLLEYGGVKGADYSVSYKRNKDSQKTDWERLALHLGATPELMNSFQKIQKGPRVLRITHKGEE